MNNLIQQIEKMKPFFEKISRNKYLRAVKDGFISSDVKFLDFRVL